MRKSYTFLRCACCGEDKNYAQFRRSPLVDSEKYFPFCKLCCNAKFKQYTEKTNNEVVALWCLLAELKIPFKKNVWEAVQQFMLATTNEGKKTSMFLSYLNYFEELGIVAHGFWESDVMLDELMGSQEKSKETKEEPDNKLIDFQEQIIIWGRFERDGELDKDAYLYLNSAFKNYTENLVEMDTNLINRYRDLCKAEWRKRKADESGDISDIAKAQDNLKKMLDMLKLSDFKSNKISNEQRAFEYKVSLIENYKPAECEELKEYLDKVGYEKEKAIDMRSLRNAIAGTRDYPELPKEYE